MNNLLPLVFICGMLVGGLIIFIFPTKSQPFGELEGQTTAEILAGPEQSPSPSPSPLPQENSNCLSVTFLDQANFDHKASLPLIILASYPRSGNSMTRALLQYATGIYTGAVYKSQDLLRGGFKGEGTYSKEKVIFFKDHFPSVSKSLRSNKHDAVYYIGRNPFDVCFSYWTYRKTGSQNETLTPEQFKEKEQDWKKFSIQCIEGWIRHYHYWKTQPKPMMISTYEKITENCEAEMERVLTFFFPSHYDRYFRPRVPCACRQVFLANKGPYKPKEHKKPVTDLFTREAVSDVLSKFSTQNFAN